MLFCQHKLHMKRTISMYSVIKRCQVKRNEMIEVTSDKCQVKRNKWPLFYLICAWFRLNLKLNYIKHLNNCYPLVTWEWYPKSDIQDLRVSLRMKNYFNFKDKIKQELCSLLVYTFKCNRCNAEYIGKNKWHYKTRTSQHISVSPLTGKCVKTQTSALHDHMLFCKTVVCPEDFSILAKSSCNFKPEIQESILMKLWKPTLNKNISSVLLYLFW